MHKQGLRLPMLTSIMSRLTGTAVGSLSLGRTSERHPHYIISYELPRVTYNVG